MRIDAIKWDDNNRAHALIRATQDEIDQAIDNRTRITTNKRGRRGDLLVFGSTDGGRPLCISIAYDRWTFTARPITAWEDR